MVTLGDEPTDAVTVADATTDGTATAGSDYTAASGTLTFAVGETDLTVTVDLTADALYEADQNETFTVTLSNPVNASIATDSGTGTGTIADSDAAPTLTIDDVTVGEDAGTATFTVTKSGATELQANVDYATADGTALAGADYIAASGFLTFAVAEVSKQISVNIFDDTRFEPYETYTVELSGAVNATLGDTQGLGKIGNTDAALELADLAGPNGFFLNGVAPYDYSSSPVSGTGDIN